MAGTHVGGDVAGGTAGTLNVVYPSVNPGDVGILYVGHSGATTVPTAPTGWTPLDSHQPGGGYSVFTDVYTRVMSGSEDGTNLAVALSSSSKFSAAMDVWRDVAVPTTAELAYTDVDNSAVATQSVPAVTFTGAAQWSTFSTGRTSTPPTSPWTVPSGTTLVDANFGTGGGAQVAGLAFSATTETDGSIGAGTWGRNNSAAMDWTTVTVALKPAVTRVTKNSTLSYNVLGHITKTGTVSYDVDGAGSRVQKNATLSYNTLTRPAAKTKTLSFNTSSVVADATWPAFISHRGGDPGPEETLHAYAATYTKGTSYWHEGDLQITANGTLVANHDDDVDRMYASGPVATGNVSSISDANWALENWRVNTGYTGSARPAMFISEWVAAYGPGSGKQTVIGLWEVKAGTNINTVLAAFATMKGQIVLECDLYADAQAAAAAGWEVAYWTQTPNFTTLVADGIKYVAIDHTNVTPTIATNAIAAGVKLLMYTVNSVANRDAALAKFSDTSYAGFMSNKVATISLGANVTKNATLSYDVLNRPAAKTKTLSFDVLVRPAAKTKTLSYNVLARATKAPTLSYNALSRGTLAKTLSFNVDGATGRIQKNATLSYNVLTRGTRTRTLSYDVLIKITKSATASYNALNRGQLNKTLSFDVQVVAGDGITIWFDKSGIRRQVLNVRA